jgi:hypothetical protein
VVIVDNVVALAVDETLRWLLSSVWKWWKWW